MDRQPTIGHNRPPLPSGADVATDLQEKHRALFTRRDEILAGARRFQEQYPDGIPNEDVQKRAADFAGGKGAMSNFLKQVRAVHTTEKAPWLEGGRAVDGVTALLTEPVERAQAHIRTAMTAYGERIETERREAARKAAEEAARIAAEAEAAALATMDPDALENAAAYARAAEIAGANANASAADLTRTRGDLGTVVSMHSRWIFNEQGSDLMTLVRAVAAGKAPLKYLQFNATAIRYAVTSERVREIPGCLIAEERNVL